MMEGNFINDGRLNWPSVMPARNFRSGNQYSGGGGKRWSVQRLADVADGILSRGVLVQEAAAGGEIEQRQTNRNGDAAPESLRPQR